MTRNELKAKIETLVDVATINMARPVPLSTVESVMALQREILQQIDLMYQGASDDESFTPAETTLDAKLAALDDELVRGVITPKEHQERVDFARSAAEQDNSFDDCCSYCNEPITDTNLMEHKDGSCVK